jgi:hypothetical protein
MKAQRLLLLFQLLYIHPSLLLVQSFSSVVQDSHIFQRPAAAISRSQLFAQNDLPENTDSTSNGSSETAIDSIAEEKYYDQEQELAIPPKDIAFVRLPPLDPSRQLTSAEQEFRDKIAFFERYSVREMALLKSKRLRVVLQGMIASPLEPDVYKAFEILYQDLLPLRVAGRLIFRRLRQVLQMCVDARAEELELLQNTTDLPLSTLEATQFAFFELIQLSTDPTRIDEVGINNDREHDLVLPIEQLQNFHENLLPKNITNCSDNQHLAAMLDPEDTGMIDFPQFVLGLQRWCEDNEDNITTEELLTQCIHKILVMAKEDYSRVLDPTRQAHSDRYDVMLESVRSWKSITANHEGEGRRWEVLKGCWVGGETEAVREALRIVYIDVPAMRVSGNTIFALVSALVPKQ